MYRILAIDGGGIRGIIPATVIEHLGATPGLENWFERTNLLAGTSTGGIIALALAAGVPVGTIAALYRDRGSAIFRGYDTPLLVRGKQFLQAAYGNKVLESELRALLGNTKLKDLEKRVAICAFRLCAGSPTCWAPKVFHNYPGDDSDGECLAADVALYTSAGPTYFPSYGGYVDGGVFANSPTMVGIAQAMDRRNPPDERARLTDIVALSLGSGGQPEAIMGERHNWGLLPWAPRLISVMMDGVAGVADFQAQHLLGDDYHRFQITFPEGGSFGLDCVGKIDEMVKMTQTALATDDHRLKTWMTEVWSGQREQAPW